MAEAPRRRPPRLVAAVLGGTLVLSLVLVEIAFRVAGPALTGTSREEVASLRAFLDEERLPLYEERPHTIYVRNSAREGTNVLGFRGGEWSLVKEPGTLRVALLGGSTTESTDPARLAQLVTERTGAPCEVFNAGISGWTSAESMLNWFLVLQDYRPDVVVLHHAINDVPPRFRRGHRADYSHFRRPWREPPLGGVERFLARWSDAAAFLVHRKGPFTVQQLTSHPIQDPLDATDDLLPFPEGAATFRRNLETIGRDAARLDARVVLMTMAIRPGDETDYEALMRRGLTEHNDLTRALAAERGWQLFDWAQRWADAPDSAARFVDLVHLDEAGRESRTQALADALAAE